MNVLVKRQKALQATMAWVGSREFAWGSTDCAKLIAFHLKQLGYKVRLSKAGPYKTALKAKAALKRLGYESLPDAMDGHGFVRILPAMMVIGDIVSFPCDHELGALGIYVGNGNMLAFHEAHAHAVVMTMNVIDTAWKVI